MYKAILGVMIMLCVSTHIKAEETNLLRSSKIEIEYNYPRSIIDVAKDIENVLPKKVKLHSSVDKRIEIQLKLPKLQYADALYWLCRYSGLVWGLNKKGDIVIAAPQDLKLEILGNNLGKINDDDLNNIYKQKTREPKTEDGKNFLHRVLKASVPEYIPVFVDGSSKICRIVIDADDFDKLTIKDLLKKYDDDPSRRMSVELNHGVVFITSPDSEYKDRFNEVKLVEKETLPGLVKKKVEKKIVIKEPVPEVIEEKKKVVEKKVAKKERKRPTPKGQPMHGAMFKKIDCGIDFSTTGTKSKTPEAPKE